MRIFLPPSALESWFVTTKPYISISFVNKSKLEAGKRSTFCTTISTRLPVHEFGQKKQINPCSSSKMILMPPEGGVGEISKQNWSGSSKKDSNYPRRKVPARDVHENRLRRWPEKNERNQFHPWYLIRLFSSEDAELFLYWGFASGCRLSQSSRSKFITGKFRALVCGTQNQSVWNWKPRISFLASQVLLARFQVRRTLNRSGSHVSARKRDSDDFFSSKCQFVFKISATFCKRSLQEVPGVKNTWWSFLCKPRLTSIHFFVWQNNFHSRQEKAFQSFLWTPN